MDRFPYATEDREDQVCDVITARIKAIQLDILTGRASTIKAVAMRVEELEAGAEEAEVLVRCAVVGHSALVGTRIAAAVSAAIYFEAEQLAETDVADMERARAESADENRISRAVAAREPA